MHPGEDPFERRRRELAETEKRQQTRRHVKQRRNSARRRTIRRRGGATLILRPGFCVACRRLSLCRSALSLCRPDPAAVPNRYPKAQSPINFAGCASMA
jgi:hypothetical protein